MTSAECKKAMKKSCIHFSHLPVEWLKLKRSPVWIPFLALPAVSSILGDYNYARTVNLLFTPALLGIFCHYIWQLERTANNWNQLFAHTSPQRIIRDKYLTTLTILCLSILWTTFLNVLPLNYMDAPDMPPVEYLTQMACCFIAGSTVAAIQLFLSLVIRNLYIPVIIALGEGVAGLLLMTKGYGYQLPYSLVNAGICILCDLLLISGSIRYLQNLKKYL